MRRSETMSPERLTVLLELTHVDVELVYLVVSEEFFPCNFSTQAPGHASQHCASRTLDANRRLVVKLTCSDALDESAIFLLVSMREVIGERSIGGKSCGFICILRRSIACPRPRVLPHNANRAGVWRFRETDGSEDALRNIKPIQITELSGGQADVDIAGIGKVHLVVIPRVAEMGKNVASPCSKSLGGMCSKHPVANVDDMDVLLYQ